MAHRDIDLDGANMNIRIQYDRCLGHHTGTDACFHSPLASSSYGCFQLFVSRKKMRRAQCSNENCKYPLVFPESSKHVRCRICESEPVPVEKLNSEKPSSMEEEIEWIQTKASFLEKRGKISVGRARMANRMIDGIVNYQHCQILKFYFETYGIRNEEVKRLRELGRSEPINVLLLSHYTAAIRKEHLDVAGYGRDFKAARYLSNVIKAMNEINGDQGQMDDILVPASISEKRWLWNAAGILSKAMVGREVFTNRIANVAVEHLNKYNGEYKKRSSINDRIWGKIENEPVLPLLESDGPCDLDLAAMANVFCRTILLLDAKSPRTVNVYVPFLWKSGKKLPPLVLAYSNQ